MDRQFSARLRKAILALGINANDFARRAGVPQGTISKCLHGHVPSPRILLRISKATGKSVDWFLTGREKRTSEGYVAERPARYGLSGSVRAAKANEEVWVAKLLKVLRGSSRRKKQTIKDLLDVLSS